MKRELPKVLVFSHNCFSKSNSNGRTLGLLFDNYPRANIAQFYIQNEWPDFAYCDNYFRVTDYQVLLSFLFKKPENCVLERDKLLLKTPNNQNVQQKKTKKTALTMLIRNLVWNLGFWKTKEYKKWIDDFCPDIIVLQAGDSAFMIRLALKEAKKRKKPLVIFNTEGYYFKKYDYFRSSGAGHWLYGLFSFLFRKEMKKALKYAAHIVYATDALKHSYDEICVKESTVIYTSTNECGIIDDFNKANKTMKISYLGNMGVGRHTGLINIANALQKINSKVSLDVYGKIPNDQVKKELEQCQAINYKGIIPYEEVVEVMQQSDINVHTESFEDFYQEDLKFAFSTKIADALACGTSFLLYAPSTLSCTRYLRERAVAHVASNEEELMSVLKKILFDEKERQKYVPNAINLAKEKHNAHNNQECFQNVLQSVYNHCK